MISCYLLGRHAGQNARVAKLLAVFVGLFLISTSSNTVQAQSKKKLKLYVGDIVEFNDYWSKRKTGLILSLQPKVVLESYDDDGKITTVRPSRSNPDVKVIDSLRAKKAERPRRWQSSDGKFTLEATLLSFDDEAVRLKRADGKTLTVPRAKLGGKDQTYLNKNASEQPANPFEVDESQDYPEEVMKLIVRRKELMAFQERHQRLLRLNRRPMVGDIIRYTTKDGSGEYGIIASLERDGTIERVSEDGTIEEDRSDLEDVSWWFYDREVRPIMSRVWKSKSGKFTLEAKLIGIDGDTLELKKPDGSIMKVPLSKLAASEQEYAEKIRPRFETSEESVEQQRSSYDADLKRLLARRDELLDRLRRYQVAAKDVSRIKSIKLSERSLESLSAEQLKPANLDGQSFSVSVDIDVARSATITEISYAKESGLVAFTIPRRDGPPKLAVVDVNASTLATNAVKDPIGEDGVVLSISPSGNTILLFSNDSRDEQQLEVWKHQNGVLTRFAAVPYESYKTPEAHLINDSSGLILNAKGALVFFNLSDRITPTHIMDGLGRSSDGISFQVSNDQRSVFVIDSNRVKLYVLDVASKRCLGGATLGPAPEGYARGVNAQVNSDGETATVIANNKLSVVQMKTGQVVKETVLPTYVGRLWGRNFPVLGPNLVRSAAGSIFDLRLGVSIGSVDNTSSRSRYFSNATRIRAEIERDRGDRADKKGGFGAKIGEVEAEERSRLVVQAETLDVNKLVQLSDQLSPEDVVVFGAGKTLALDIDVGDAATASVLEKHLTSLMSDANVEIAAESDFVMKLRFTTGEPVTKTFDIVEGLHSFGVVHRFNSTKVGERTVTITPKTASAVLTYRGERLMAVSDSVALGYPRTVEQLNLIVSKASTMNARQMTKFKYSTDFKMLLPSKKVRIEWR